MNKIFGVVLAVIGSFALGGIALYRQEPINSLWIVVASVCMYLLGYRFYAAWIAAKVYLVDPTRATPAERLNNGRDFVPTQKWVAFGHHFAAIAGPGPADPLARLVRHGLRAVGRDAGAIPAHHHDYQDHSPDRPARGSPAPPDPDRLQHHPPAAASRASWMVHR